MIQEKNVKSSIKFLNKLISPANDLMLKLNHEAILDWNDLDSDQRKITKSMIKQDVLDSVGRGIIIDKGWSPNDFLLRQLVLKQGIYSGNTALYLWEISDQFPYSIEMTFKTGYKLPVSLEKWTKNVNVRQVDKSKINLFVDEMKVTGTDKTIKLYTPERCLVELFQGSANDFNRTAELKNYLASPSGNANKLLMTAKELGNYKKIRHILEILL